MTTITVNYLDLTLLCVLSFFVVRGVMHGLIEEAAGLIGVVGGLFASYKYHGLVAPYLVGLMPDQSWRDILAYVFIFITVLLVVGLVARLLQKLVKFAFANFVDKLGGAGIGLLKGMVLCAIVLNLTMPFFAQAAFVRESRIIPHIASFMDVFRELLPQNLV